MYVRKGDNVTLECIRRVERMYITWLGPPNLTILTTGNKITRNLTSISIIGSEANYEHFLRITDFTDRHNGVYDCYTFYPSEEHLYFNVILRRNPMCLKVVNATDNNEIFCVENKEVTLECRVKTGQPKGYLQWKRGSHVLETCQHDIVTYKFIPRSLDNSKSYTCEALNDKMEKKLEKTVRLLVYNRPDVKILGKSLQYVQEGQELKLICQHDSNDKDARISWIWDAIPRMSYPGHAGNSLVIRHVNRNRSGNYTCEISSRGGIGLNTVSVTVQYAPNVSITVSKTMTSNILFCKAKGIPDDYKFDKWEHVSFPDEHIRYLKATVDGVLVVPTAVVGSESFYQNVGIYKCRVSNGIRDVHGNLYQMASAKIAFAGKPLFLNAGQGQQFRKNGKTISAELYVYSCPKFYEVIVVRAKHLPKIGPNRKRHQYVIQEHQTEVTAEFAGRKFVIPAYKITITFENATDTDIGHGIFVVENEYGSANVTFDITPAAFKKDQNNSGSSHAIVYAGIALGLILIIGIIAFLSLTERGRQWKSSCVQKIRGSANEEVHAAGAVVIENEVNDIGNIAVTADSTPPVYSLIDKRANVSIDKTVSYAASIAQNLKPSKHCTEKKRNDKGSEDQEPMSAMQGPSSKENPELNFVDVCFDSKPTEYRFKIHGIENNTPYAEVSSDEEEHSDEADID